MRLRRQSIGPCAGSRRSRTGCGARTGGARASPYSVGPRRVPGHLRPRLLVFGRQANLIRYPKIHSPGTSSQPATDGGQMRIGVVGAGHIGGTAAKLFARADHQVAVSNSRGPSTLASLVSSIGPSAKATSVVEAVKFGEAVLLALPYRKMDALPSAESFAGKIVIDAMNPYSAVGGVMDLGDSTSSEEVAKRMPAARLVKAFNTMGWNTLASGSRPVREERLVVFIAGDDAPAKAAVAKLIDEIGFASIDTGSLREGGRRQQPGSRIYGRPMTVREAKKILG